MSKHHQPGARKERRAQFTEARSNTKRTPVVVMLGTAFLLLGVVVLIVAGGSRSGPAAVVEAAEAGPAGGDVVFAASTFDDGQARFFRYATAAGREIRFFVMKSSDGVIRAAFDSCDVCYRERKGYSQSGDAMICNKCGKAFPSTQINVLQGGCNPAPIERSVVNGQVTLSAAALAQGVAYF